MRGQLPARDRAVAALAAQQEAMVSFAQMRALGLSEKAIETRGRRGGLHRYHRGVYIVGVRRVTPRGRLWAAVLACGGAERAAISHLTALAAYRIRDRAPVRVDVMTTRHSESTRRIHVHTTRSLDADRDLTRLHGLPITTPSRCLVDSAPLLTAHELHRACGEAAYLELLDAEDLRRRLERRPAGARDLRAALDAHARTGVQITKSELENLFLALVDRHDLPPPLVNAPLLGYTVDFLWPESRLVVETDGLNHLRPTVFESDRERDTVLVLHAYRVVRVTWRQLTERPDHVAATLRQLASA